jgi:hypothetical protein
MKAPPTRQSILTWIVISIVLGTILAFLAPAPGAHGQSQPQFQTKIEIPGVTSYTMLIEIGDGGGYAVASQAIGGYVTFSACAFATQELIRQKKAIDDRSAFHLYCIPTNIPPTFPKTPT